MLNRHSFIELDARAARAPCWIRVASVLAGRSTASNRRGWSHRASPRKPPTARSSPRTTDVPSSSRPSNRASWRRGVGRQDLPGAAAAADSRAGTPTAAVILFETGGVRLQEANLGLNAVAELCSAILDLRPHAPVIGVVAGTVGSFGGMSIAAGCAPG